MIDYYEKCKNYLNKEIIVFSLHRVDFSRTPYVYQVIPNLNVKTSDIIDNYISHIKNNVLPVLNQDDESYEKLVEKDDVNNFINVASLLDFSYDLDKPEEDYPLVKISF